MTTFLGTPVTLEGIQLKEGDTFPEFTVVKTDLTEIEPLKEPGEKIILAVPSIDTGVCSMEVAKFMNFIKGQDKVKVYSVSMDLPFALDRWCQAQGNDQVVTTSDYKDRSFAKASGTRMEENGLLARAVFVVDEDGKVKYAEYVDEVSHEPDYEAVLKAADLK